MTNTFERLVALDEAHNVRDLGGYATAAQGMTRWRSLLRGDALHRLTEADIERLLAIGVSTVIDLRNAQETAAEENPFRTHASVRFHNVSLFEALAPAAMALSANGHSFDMAARYRDALDNCQPAIAAVLRAIADAPDGIVLFHCTAGKDRTGIIAALLLSLAGVAEEIIADDYALTATISGPLIGRLRERALGRGTEPDLVERMLACEPETMRTTLDHLRDIYGGTTVYLATLGLDPAEQDRLRQRLG
ncbi:MAG: tyrosine-protein phosphatase [Rhizobiaceae bacterium]|nr:tyrosine-protein phosphatase [Rhizobiaceae bacterium]